MNKLHRQQITVKSLIKRKLLLLPVLVFATFLPALVPTTQAVQHRLSGARDNRQKPYLVNTGSAGVTRISFGADLLPVNVSYNAAPRIIRKPARALQSGGDEFGCDSGDYQCSGSTCYHQCLLCVNGTITSSTGCCITCCNGAGNCATECCSPR